MNSKLRNSYSGLAADAVRGTRIVVGAGCRGLKKPEKDTHIFRLRHGRAIPDAAKGEVVNRRVVERGEPLQVGRIFAGGQLLERLIGLRRRGARSQPITFWMKALGSLPSVTLVPGNGSPG